MCSRFQTITILLAKRTRLSHQFFSAVRKRKSCFFGPDVTSNFREGLEKKSPRVLGPPCPGRIGIRKDYHCPLLQSLLLDYFFISGFLTIASDCRKRHDDNVWHSVTPPPPFEKSWLCPCVLNVLPFLSLHYFSVPISQASVEQRRHFINLRRRGYTWRPFFHRLT